MNNHSTTAPQKQPTALALDVDGIPEWLKEKDQSRWACWQFEQDAKGRWGKVPKQPISRDGRELLRASARVENQWSTFDKCHKLYEAGTVDGIGLMVGAQLVAVDLDDAFDDDGNLKLWAYKIVKRLDSYTELSPSGNGLHILVTCKADLPNRDHDLGDGKIQLFTNNHFVTITGHIQRRLTLKAGAVWDRTDELQALFDELWPVQSTPPVNVNAGSYSQSQWWGDDQQFWDTVFAGKGGNEARQYYAGNLVIGDHSRDDLKLCGTLAFYTGGDAAAIDYFFRQTGLYRDKWERQDYRDDTISKAINGCKSFYTPRQIDPDALKAAQAAIGDQSMNGNHSGNSAPQTNTGWATGSGSAPQAQPSGNAPVPDLLRLDVSDLGNALAVEMMHPGHFAYNDAYGWMAWAGTHWETGGSAKARVMQAINAALAERVKQAAISGNMGAHQKLINFCAANKGRVTGAEFQLQHLPSVAVDPEEFDKQPDKLNCLNGVVDLRTGDIEPHDPKYRFTYCIPVAYIPGTDYSEWVDLLKTWVAPDQLDTLQIAAGYTATGHTREELLFYLFGPTRSGKGTFTETLHLLLGKPLSAEVSFSTFLVKRDGDSQNFDLAGLKPCRAVFASESKDHDRLDGAKVKLITGGNEVYCSFKHKDLFNYRPRYKIWLSSNFPVNGDPDDEALWGRIRIFHFPNSYLGREDKRIKERCKSPAMLGQVLAWIVDGAKAWYALGPTGIQETSTGARLKSHTINELDTISQWIDESCIVDANYTELQSALYGNYESWCRANGVTPKKLKGFKASLEKRGFRHAKRNKGKIWHGLKLPYTP